MLLDENALLSEINDITADMQNWEKEISDSLGGLEALGVGGAE